MILLTFLSSTPSERSLREDRLPPDPMFLRAEARVREDERGEALKAETSIPILYPSYTRTINECTDS